ncbi:MAG: magnesium and cobalt transport protein CorA [Ornithinimicrobium sp.]
MIVDQAVYRSGKRADCSDLSGDLAHIRQSDDGFLWVGLKDPTEAEFEQVKVELDLHPLAVADAINGKQRVKIEAYDHTHFAVVRTLRYLEETSDIETGEIMIFVGDRFVVTVRIGEGAPLVGVRKRLENRPELLAADGPITVFHAVLDTIVDTYREIDVEVLQDLNEIEKSVFSPHETASSSTIYGLKREVLEFRRAAQPLLEPLRTLYQNRSVISSEEMRLELRDVGDHLTHVVEHIDSYDNLLTDILSAHLAQVGVQQNDDMRKISAWVAIAAVPTLMAGIFGMNFEHMPGLQWTWGYPLSLVFMAGICVALYRAFRRSGWL